MDIVKRLRTGVITNGLMLEAADEIERLTAALTNLIADLEGDDLAWRASVADARAALSQDEQKEDGK